VLNFTRFLVRDRHRCRAGDDFIIEFASGLRSGSALLRLKTIFVLTVTADLIARSHDFSCLQHGHVNVLVHLQQLMVRRDTHFRRLDKADRFHAAADANVHIVDDDLLGGRRNRHQAR
jgi:hypothetical protein